jgi:DNA helicase IV
VRVLSPDDARGLEFDAVLVIEPADFPRHHDHDGALYTSLTRANKELSIVHAKPPPAAHKRAASSSRDR